MESIRVEKIFVDNNRLCVKTANGTYEKIYRSGMSVDWDSTLNALFYNGRETPHDNKIDIIIKAIQNEYKINLIIDENTIIEV